MSGKVPPSDIAKARRLYSDFSGHDGDEVAFVKTPDAPRVLAVIGELEAVIYSTVRDDNAERYIHKFRQKSRALLCVSPDGGQLYIVGGNYEFTERGIVDK